MNVDGLLTWVSEAIWRAERYEDQGHDAAHLWVDVSRIEEQLASVVPGESAEGYLARDGAVRAALKAGDPMRARDLALRFAEEAGVSESLREALRQLIEEDERGVATRFQPAAVLFPLHDVRVLAKRLHEAGAFGLAA